MLHEPKRPPPLPSLVPRLPPRLPDNDMMWLNLLPLHDHRARNRSYGRAGRDTVSQGIGWQQTIPAGREGKVLGGRGRQDNEGMDTDDQDEDMESERNNLDTDHQWMFDIPPLNTSARQPSSQGGGRESLDSFVMPNSSTSPSSSGDGGEFGPVYGEEEDLRRAIEMSLQEQPLNPGQYVVGVLASHGWRTVCEAKHYTTMLLMIHSFISSTAPASNMMNVSGPQFDSNRLATSPVIPPVPHYTLPPELRHLLQSSERCGETV